jgi:hypothetical protein
MGALLAAAIVLLNRLKIVLTQVLLLAGLTTWSPCDTISSIFQGSRKPLSSSLGRALQHVLSIVLVGAVG